MKLLMRSIYISALAGGWLALTSCASNKTAPAGPAAVNGASTGPATATATAAAPGSGVDANDDYAVADVYDPWEGLNRATFKFNDGFYTVVLRPVSKGYKFVFPKPVRRGIGNAFTNIRFPVRLVNGALQGNFKKAGQETGMFLVNTVAGVGGLFKVSDKIPALADVSPEDTGQTFGKWGMGHGPYFVLPILGPCSVRDTAGFGVDYVLNPVNWGIFWSDGGDWKSIPPYANTIQMSPEQLDLYDVAIENAVDPYISARSVYIQNRAHAVEQ